MTQLTHHRGMQFPDRPRRGTADSRRRLLASTFGERHHVLGTLLALLVLVLVGVFVGSLLGHLAVRLVDLALAGTVGAA